MHTEKRDDSRASLEAFWIRYRRGSCRCGSPAFHRAHRRAGVSDGHPGDHLHEGRRTDTAAQLSELPSARLGGPDNGRLREAAGILDGLVSSEEFVEFLTLPAYSLLP